jgi:transcriptional regulator with XRE-family HTH domain
MDSGFYTDEEQRRRLVMELLRIHLSSRQREHPLKSKIYDCRMQNNWSLKKLAAMAGVPLNTVWRMERGYGVTLRNAFKVANAFQLTVYELWDIPSSGSAAQEHRLSGAAINSVHELRVTRCWRLHDLAKLSGVSKATLAQVESGHIPTLKNAVRIAAALGSSVYQIWGPQERGKPQAAVW